jgi:hypothetical protein
MHWNFGGPCIDGRLEAETVRAAVPEELGDLDLVRAAHGRLTRHHADVVLAFLELPVLYGRIRAVGTGQHDRLFIVLRLGGGLLHDDLGALFFARCVLFGNDLLFGRGLLRR